MAELIGAVLAVVLIVLKFYFGSDQQGKREAKRENEQTQNLRKSIADGDADAVSAALDRLRRPKGGVSARRQQGVSGDGGSTLPD